MDTRDTQQQDKLTKILIALIVVLAVVLVVVICVAVGGGTDPQNPSGSSSSSFGSSESSSSSSSSSVNAGLSVQPLTDPEDGTVAEYMEFSGTCDPNAALTVNDISVVVGAQGDFNCRVPLTVGENKIKFIHKEQTVEFTVERRYVVAKYSPNAAQEYNSGATIYFEVAARAGSSVTAEFNGQTYTLKEAANQQGTALPEGFVLYTYSYKLTNTNTSNLALGTVTYTAACDGVTETYVSGELTCLKAADILASNPGVTPDYGDYIDVGSGYIVEIINYSAETFDGKTTDDYSHPTNNYLPKGTVDYCSTELVQRGNLKYVQMRCGYRVYLDKKNYPPVQRTDVVDRYVGTLPDHNEIGFVSMTQEGNHTILTLDCLWKAPFYFDILPQEYLRPNGGSDRSYEITAFTATHIDITFCYATEFAGTVKIDEGNPIFKSAELIQNESDCTLRLHLKKTGGFYGWDAYYNDDDQLCFSFLNPAKVSQADNDYGADLSGVTIMIDVGHGGLDGGAVGKDTNGTAWSEAGRNMDLAYALRKELESMGATVVFNREGQVNITVDERVQIVKNAAPDFCIAIHHNSIDGHPNISGYLGGYYTPYSMLASKRILKHTIEADVYEDTILTWFNYYVSRQTCCPIVLTENGYMSNLNDLTGALDEEIIEKKAIAMAQGIADYFLLINGYTVK